MDTRRRRNAATGGRAQNTSPEFLNHPTRSGPASRTGPPRSALVMRAKPAPCPSRAPRAMRASTSRTRAGSLRLPRCPWGARKGQSVSTKQALLGHGPRGGTVGFVLGVGDDAGEGDVHTELQVGGQLDVARGSSSASRRARPGTERSSSTTVSCASREWTTTGLCELARELEVPAEVVLLGLARGEVLEEVEPGLAHGHARPRAGTGRGSPPGRRGRGLGRIVGVDARGGEDARRDRGPARRPRGRSRGWCRPAPCDRPRPGARARRPHRGPRRRRSRRRARGCR